MEFSEIYEKCVGGEKIVPGMEIAVKEITIDEIETRLGPAKKTTIEAIDGQIYYSFSKIIAAQAGMILQVCGECPDPSDPLILRTVPAKTAYGKLSVKFEDGRGDE